MSAAVILRSSTITVDVGIRGGKDISTRLANPAKIEESRGEIIHSEKRARARVDKIGDAIL